MPPSNVDHTFLRVKLRRNGGVGPIQRNGSYGRWQVHRTWLDKTCTSVETDA